MHDEVFEAAHDSGSQSRDLQASAASSPSEAYANMTLDGQDGSASMAQDSDGTVAVAVAVARTNTQSEQAPPRPPPRSSSPAKRLHSDMEDTGKTDMDVDSPATSAPRESGRDSPRPTKPLPATAPRSIRAASVEMLDAGANGDSASTSESNPSSNYESTATSLSGATPAAGNAPSVDEQVSKVLALCQKDLFEGQEGYVVPNKWLERVFARTSENINKPGEFTKGALEGPIGPVPTISVVDPAFLGEAINDRAGIDFVPLKPGLAMGQDFEILPFEAWELIMAWYGLEEDNPIIRRTVRNTALVEYQRNLQYELYPPIFTIRKLRRSATDTQTLADSAKRSPRLVASRGDMYVDFLRAAKTAAGVDMKRKVQVWRVVNAVAPAEPSPQQPSGMLTPDSSPRNGSPAAGPPVPQNQAPQLLIDLATFNELAEGTEREMVTSKDETANEKYNGHMTLGTAGLAEDQVLILEEQDGKGSFASESSTKAAAKNGLQSGNNKAGGKVNRGLNSNTNSGRNSPAPGPMTRGRTRSGRTRGTVGLTNLGNTCYMNSALQCIRSVEELCWYFLQDNYKQDLNPDNPLGHGGTIAKSYAGLLAAIYDDNGTSSFSPKNFKNTLGRAQPLFSGYGQQDSQEFLSFLVDGLHEDLNRVKKKPYTENPDSDDKTVHDPEAIKALGQKYREIHHSRNDSVAMDLFNGFYKNTMVCPDCEKVSITFDPYSLLTLQLPIEQTWQHTITFVPLYGAMVNVEVDIDKNGTIKNLKEYVAKRFPGTKWNHLMGAEVYSHKFYRVLEDNKSIAECNIGTRDDIFFFELDSKPTNWPPPKKPQKFRSMIYPSASSEEDIPNAESPLGDRMLVPIFHRAPSMSTYRGHQFSLVLWPSYIVVTREEARDYDSILRKVVGKVAQMTTRPILTEHLGSYASLDQSRTGSDTVLTTEEDASPDGDPRVQDGSIEGEDMVEVTMTEPTETPAGQAMDEEKEQLPEVIQPGGFIPPEFRHMFTMRHTRAGKEMVPTGWSSVDQNKAYEEIAARIRQPPSRQSSVQSLDENSTPSSSEETDDQPQFSFHAAASLEAADQSSEEEMQSIETPEFARGGRQKNGKKQNKHDKRKAKKAMKTYSKKGKGRFSEQPSTSFSDPESDEDDSLLRLGEAIVLEWNPEAYDALFDGTNEHDQRGMETLKFIETLEDAELQAKKAKRLARKRNGITLEECFAETSKSEILSEDNAWYCNRCKELRRATKTLEIWTVPDILVVHLKRFSAHRTFRDKIEALVDFPTEGLDLGGKVGLPEDKELVYDLFAVDNHFGGLGGGHYTAYAQNFFDKKWYNYNDSSVSTVKDPNSVVTSNAYLLFYRRRRADGPLGPPYLQNIVNVVWNPDSEDNDNAEDSDTAARTKDKDRNASPAAGNGLRLGDSSRNGSSSASLAAAAGARPKAVGAIGSGLAGVGSRAGAGAVNRDVEMMGEDIDAVDPDALDDADVDDALPPYQSLVPDDADEGYGGDGDGDGDGAAYGDTDLNEVHAPMYSAQLKPGWNFGGVGVGSAGSDDDAASDQVNMGSDAEVGLQERMLEDFGDEIGDGEGMRGREGTPVLVPLLGEEDGEEGMGMEERGVVRVGMGGEEEGGEIVEEGVVDVVLDDEMGEMPELEGESGHEKMD
ncbi:hypothetical protein BCR34DRAFT_605535 [Clohesyomyces aquaticus]|uniref:ubiquitinyl hydrolase 1 n=1 Tax=Clohesyomyces aquaticus TaxID=1231657 RepID=A0A1Y1YXF6_9PLEO|nr:hypothetical protein BCR34DRAFT_605535 [Clohesyomyces aquaticus]